MGLSHNHEMVVWVLVNGNKKFTSLSTQIGRLAGEVEKVPGAARWAQRGRTWGRSGPPSCPGFSATSRRGRRTALQGRRAVPTAPKAPSVAVKASVCGNLDRQRDSLGSSGLCELPHRWHGSYQLANTQGAMWSSSAPFPICPANSIARLFSTQLMRRAVSGTVSGASVKERSPSHRRCAWGWDATTRHSPHGRGSGGASGG